MDTFGGFSTERELDSSKFRTFAPDFAIKPEKWMSLLENVEFIWLEIDLRQVLYPSVGR